MQSTASISTSWSPKLACGVKTMRRLLIKSIYWSIFVSAYELWIIMAFCLQYSTRSWRESSFIGVKTICLFYSIVACSRIYLKVPCRFSSSQFIFLLVQPCLVHWLDPFISKLNSMFCGPISPEMSIPHTSYFLQKGQKFEKMFVVIVEHGYSFLPFVFKASVVRLLDILVFPHLLDTFGFVGSERRWRNRLRCSVLDMGNTCHFQNRVILKRCTCCGVSAVRR